MDYNARAMRMLEANHPYYRPTEVLEAQVQQGWVDDPYPREFTQGDRVWVQPREGRGYYGLVLESILVRSEHDCIAVLPETSGPTEWWASHRLTIIRSA